MHPSRVRDAEEDLARRLITSSQPSSARRGSPAQLQASERTRVKQPSPAPLTKSLCASSPVLWSLATRCEQVRLFGGQCAGLFQVPRGVSNHPLDRSIVGQQQETIQAPAHRLGLRKVIQLLHHASRARADVAPVPSGRPSFGFN